MSDTLVRERQPMLRRRPVVLVSALVLAMVAVGGCGDGGDEVAVEPTLQVSDDVADAEGLSPEDPAGDEDTSSVAAGDEFTRVYELDGNFEDAFGGPPLVATGGSFGAEGFVFEPGDGLTADIDLGESYTIEFRVRIDQSDHAIKLFDFRDRSSEAGLYVLDEEFVIFWFAEGCDGLVDEALGCPPSLKRQPMAVVPYQVVLGEWFTMTFTRHGDRAELSAAIDGVEQSWQARYQYGNSPEGVVPLEVERVDDSVGEATQRLTTKLHIVSDDTLTSNENGRGELDYVKITVGERR